MPTTMRTATTNAPSTATVFEGDSASSGGGDIE
ncbi:Uncharacterised protein [Mycobacteroides abscessus subsp. abscessus]|nr:Uncharacterised protein [Mycobacteroides abscessus subsp. abscessus]